MYKIKINCFFNLKLTVDKQEENIKLENKKQLEFKSLKDKVF